MCGIIGEISTKKIDTEKFIQMRDELTHRGPDDAGLYINQEGNVALGHRRLSIIDLTSSGREPMSDEDDSVWLTFNGEIYNHRELREELIKKGHRFKSRTDAEVIIHSYQEWGIDSLKKLRGMFAFAIWDEEKNRLFLARDRIGIKPLYYYAGYKRFVFSSELKGIIKDVNIERRINPTALKYYLI
jgi:asparagine synthase (glutamine-hydrolysing)